MRKRRNMAPLAPSQIYGSDLHCPHGLPDTAAVKTSVSAKKCIQRAETLPLPAPPLPLLYLPTALVVQVSVCRCLPARHLPTTQLPLRARSGSAAVLARMTCRPSRAEQAAG